MLKLKRWLVLRLEDACEWTHHHPYPCRLALLSSHLDERWGTGMWMDDSDPEWVEFSAGVDPDDIDATVAAIVELRERRMARS